jgi:ABC-2 type transport system ATP-binding protein
VPPAIEIESLVKRFGEVVAVDGLSLSIPAGECLGMLGPNGAGKTTTIEILEGLQEPTAGQVRVLGMGWSQDATRIRARIGVQLQSTEFEDKLTVEETVDLFRSFYDHGLDTAEAIRLLQLDEKKKARTHQLSGGQKQRLALATALVGDPELLFLDEPTTGLDPQSRRALWDVIAEIRSRGRTVLLTTHYMDEAERLCDRVVIVDHGKIVAQGTPAALIAEVGGDAVVELQTRPALAAEALAAVPGVVSCRAGAAGLTLAVKEVHRALPVLLDAVRAAGVALDALSTRHATLDDVFLAKTGRSLREDA